MRGSIDSYRDLLVWQRSMALAVSVYHLTSAYPADERFGLTAQTRRAATSIPANIAECYGRATKGAYVNFLRIAQGSLKELETHLILATKLGFASDQVADPCLGEADEIGRMLATLIGKVERSMAHR